MADLAQAVGSILITISALLALAAVVAHQMLARWWRTPAGRHAFSFEAVLALSLTLWAVRLAVPEGDWFLAVRLAAFALVPVVLAWRLIVIVQTWRRNRRSRRSS
ncbi:hypothetical protein MF672_038710 [Actinomadura sp. ATCC 31491]|uniref:DUF1622 domain-containing protein n=1 Tax=Actinomadura luzonensis TaxID=2805427 RepID=A0ABT0G501_9ACTN|nr:hypothetical protein [Actinomadura luzonensis]MCK2219686.1 hypothetical protein [Actinomadura luzonensis]